MGRLRGWMVGGRGWGHGRSRWLVQGGNSTKGQRMKFRPFYCAIQTLPRTARSAQCGLPFFAVHFPMYSSMKPGFSISPGMFLSPRGINRRSCTVASRRYTQPHVLRHHLYMAHPPPWASLPRGDGTSPPQPPLWLLQRISPGPHMHLSLNQSQPTQKSAPNPPKELEAPCLTSAPERLNEYARERDLLERRSSSST